MRNPLKIQDVTEVFRDSGFSLFNKAIQNGYTPQLTFVGCVIRAIPAPRTSEKPRNFFDKMIESTQSELHAQGLAYIIFDEQRIDKRRKTISFHAYMCFKFWRFSIFYL